LRFHLRIASQTPNSKTEKEVFSFFRWLIGLFRKLETNCVNIPYGGMENLALGSLTLLYRSSASTLLFVSGLARQLGHGASH
jgi:hypothetical protein